MLKSTKDWLKMAPLPVLWIAVMFLSGWLYRLQAEQDNTVNSAVAVDARVKILEDQWARVERKIDYLTELMLEMRTGRRAKAEEPPAKSVSSDRGFPENDRPKETK